LIRDEPRREATLQDSGTVQGSVSVAELRTDIESALTLLRSDGKALYAAKSGGRNRGVVAG
jgi:hypothetical protein